jgi:hypothetical protein
MGWWVALDIALYVGSVVAFFMGYGWIALICIILAILLTLILTGSSGSSGSSFIFIDDFKFCD